VGLLSDQRDFVVVLWGEEELRPRIADLGQLGAEVGVFGVKLSYATTGASAVDYLPRRS